MQEKNFLSKFLKKYFNLLENKVPIGILEKPTW